MPLPPDRLFLVALVLFLLALLLIWYARRQRQRLGLPSGRLLYSDTNGWLRLEKPLFYGPLQLTGKPDYVIRNEQGIIPVEVKSGRAPAAPYDSHVHQLAAYCLLVEKTYGQRPPYGVIHYEDRDFAIDYTPELEGSLLRLLASIRRDQEAPDVSRSHEQAARCARCGFQAVCDQRLA